MSVNEDHFRQLLDKYASRKASPEELEELFALIKDSANDNEWHQLLVSVLEDTDPIKGEESVWNRQFDGLLVEAKSREMNKEKPGLRMDWRRLAVAASIIVALSFGYFLMRKPPVRQIAQMQPEILPGTDKAILLSHGKQYQLTGTKNGLILQNGNVAVRKTSDGVLAYNQGTGNQATTAIYDTLVVPRGGQHRLILSDGTVAYLNADTKIRYPEKFSGPERIVELLSGEADLVVKPNPAMPFKLLVRGQEIHDIGTEFNVNAYDDEPGVTTTLVEGAVKINLATDKIRAMRLQPGQQAITRPGSEKIEVTAGNPEEAIAWRNGYFRYDNIELKELMKQVARWYDVEVSYQGSIGKKEFYMDMKRKTDLSNVLKILEQGGIHFKITGRKLTIINN